MSLFDVIRYPISDTPTKDQLDNLPIEIYKEWAFVAGWAYPADNSKPPDTELVSYFYQNADHGYQCDIVNLRKLIAEYESI
jgi:hypothetical protein